MGEELISTAKAIHNLEPAAEAFMEATGLLGPPREFAAWATDLIRYRRAPHQAKLLMRAAEKIRASGLPAAAVEDKLLRAILEDGPLDDDKAMQERWANLLANAGTTKLERVKAAYPRILSELEPEEADILDRLVENIMDPETALTATLSIHEWLTRDFGLDNVDNIVRLGLMRYVAHSPSLSDDPHTIQGVRFTDLGWEFVQACRRPQADRKPSDSWRWRDSSGLFHAEEG
jgi:hypothetical protein